MEVAHRSNAVPGASDVPGASRQDKVSGTDTADTAADPADTGTDTADTAADPADTGTDTADTAADPADTGTDPADTAADPADTGTDPADTAADPADTGTDTADTAADPETIVRGYWERIWLSGDLDALEDLVADPVTRHTAEGTHTLTRAELRRRLAGAFEALRACEVAIDALVTDGATVWVRLTLRCVSLANAAPTTLAWIAQYRIADGRIAEIWGLHQAGLDWNR